MLADHDRRADLRQEFVDKWATWKHGPADARQEIPLPGDWAQSVDAFLAAGLPMPILLECVDAAMGNQKVKVESTFRYVCGIAWRKVGELQEGARRGLASPDAAAEEPAQPDLTEAAAMEILLGIAINHDQNWRVMWPAQQALRDLLRRGAEGYGGLTHYSETAEGRAQVRLARRALDYITEVINDNWGDPPTPEHWARPVGNLVRFGLAPAAGSAEASPSPASKLLDVMRTQWAELVGAELGERTEPTSLKDGVLTITADNSAWSLQVKLLRTSIKDRLNYELGDGAVLEVIEQARKQRRPEGR